MNHFVFGYGCAAVAGVATIALPAAACATYSHPSPSDIARYDNLRVIAFPQTIPREEVPTHHLALDRLHSLENGWDSYNAPKPCREAIAQAKELATKLKRSGLAIEHIGPSVIGGVGITVEEGGIEYAIEFRNSGKVVVTEINPGSGLKVHNVTDSSSPADNILSLLDKGLN